MLDLKADEIFKDKSESTLNIDNVFKEITKLYDKRIMKIIYNSLQMIESEQNSEFREHYAEGLKIILKPMEVNIRKWIVEKLAC